MKLKDLVACMTWSVLGPFVNLRYCISNGPIFVVDCGYQLCYCSFASQYYILIAILSLFISILWWWNFHFSLLQNWFILFLLCSHFIVYNQIRFVFPAIATGFCRHMCRYSSVKAWILVGIGSSSDWSCCFCWRKG